LPRPKSDRQPGSSGTDVSDGQDDGLILGATVVIDVVCHDDSND